MAKHTLTIEMQGAPEPCKWQNLSRADVLRIMDNSFKSRKVTRIIIDVEAPEPPPPPPPLFYDLDPPPSPVKNWQEYLSR